MELREQIHSACPIFDLASLIHPAELPHTHTNTNDKPFSSWGITYDNYIRNTSVLQLCEEGHVTINNVHGFVQPTQIGLSTILTSKLAVWFGLTCSQLMLTEAMMWHLCNGRVLYGPLVFPWHHPWGLRLRYMNCRKCKKTPDYHFLEKLPC